MLNASNCDVSRGATCDIPRADDDDPLDDLVLGSDVGIGAYPRRNKLHKLILLNPPSRYTVAAITNTDDATQTNASNKSLGIGMAAVGSSLSFEKG